MDLPGRVVFIPSLVLELVALPESDQADRHPSGGPPLLLEVLDQAEEVGVDVVGPARIEQDVSAPRDLVQGPVQRCPIEEGDLIGELDVNHLAPQMLLDDPSEGPSDVCSGG